MESPLVFTVDLQLFLSYCSAVGLTCWFLSLAILSRAYPKAVLKMYFWNWACGLCVVGNIILAGLMPILPQWRAFLGNGLILIGMILMYLSLRQFAALSPVAWKSIAGLLCGFAVFTWFNFVDENYRVRVLVISLIYILLALMNLKVLILMDDKRAPERVQIFLFVLLACGAAGRLASILGPTGSEHFLSTQDNWQKISIIFIASLMLAIILNFLVVVSSRLRSSLEYLKVLSDFDETKTQQLKKHERDIRDAIRLNQLSLFYQPRLTCQTLKIQSVEALLRWRHPSGRLICPGEFLPLIENRPIMCEVGEWVLVNAIEVLNRITAEIPDFHMSINVAAQQLEDPLFLPMLRNALQNAKFHRGNLEFEITESAVMSNVATAERVLSEITGMGISISVDDFGTGYSSLAYLHRFPISCLKIDQSFIRCICGDGSDHVIAEAVISLGQALKLNTVAEGVEKIEQLNVLVKLGCNEIQGYYISPPLPEFALRHFLVNWAGAENRI